MDQSTHAASDVQDSAIGQKLEYLGYDGGGILEGFASMPIGQGPVSVIKSTIVHLALIGLMSPGPFKHRLHAQIANSTEEMIPLIHVDPEKRRLGNPIQDVLLIQGIVMVVSNESLDLVKVRPQVAPKLIFDRKAGSTLLRAGKGASAAGLANEGGILISRGPGINLDPLLISDSQPGAQAFELSGCNEIKRYPNGIPGLEMVHSEDSRPPSATGIRIRLTTVQFGLSSQVGYMSSSPLPHDQVVLVHALLYAPIQNKPALMQKKYPIRKLPQRLLVVSDV